MNTAIRAAIVLAALLAGSLQASAATLITDEEAERPTDLTAEVPRGITRGPTIHFDPPEVAYAHQPFPFVVTVEPHGGATVDPAKIHVTYLKLPNVDLTRRLQTFVTTNGVDMPNAETPAGTHPLRIDVEDSDGRVSRLIVTLTVLDKATIARP